MRTKIDLGSNPDQKSVERVYVPPVFSYNIDSAIEIENSLDEPNKRLIKQIYAAYKYAFQV